MQASIRTNLIYNFFLSASQLLLPLVSIPYVSRVLDPAGIGKVSFIDSLTYYFVSMAEFGIVVYGVREVARVRGNPPALSSLISELISLHLITSTVSLCIYAAVVYFVWDKIGDPRLLAFSVAFLLVNGFACEWYFYGTEQFRYIAIRSIATRLAGLAGIFLLIKQPSDYYIYYGLIVFAGIGNMLLNIASVFSHFKLKLKTTGLKKHIKRTWVTYFISLAYSISLMLDNVFLGLVSTSAIVGIYAFAMKLVRLSAVGLTDTLLVFFPQAVSLLHAGQQERFQETVLKNVRLLILFSIPIGAGLYFLSDEITRAFFGPAFQSISHDLKILSVIPFLKCYNLFLSKQILIAYDKEKLYLKSLLICGLLFIAATLLLSSVWDDRGACYAMVLYESVLIILNYAYVKQTARSLLVFDWKTFGHAIIGTILFVPLIFVLKPYSWPTGLLLAIIIVSSAVIYCLFQVFVTRNELMVSLLRSTLSQGVRPITRKE